MCERTHDRHAANDLVHDTLFDFGVIGHGPRAQQLCEQMLDGLAQDSVAETAVTMSGSAVETPAR